MAADAGNSPKTVHDVAAAAPAAAGSATPAPAGEDVRARPGPPGAGDAAPRAAARRSRRVRPTPDPRRPREKLAASGPGALTDGELLAVVLKSGVTGRSATRIGRRLARRTPRELATWNAARWLRVSGIGLAGAAALTAAFELGRRAHQRDAARPAIRGPEDVRALTGDLAAARKEHFVVLLLNARHELERRETVSIGSLNASIVHPREVFLPAILHSAASVVLVHNHPSGDPEPSDEDLSITRRLVQVGDLVGIGVLDHVIVAEHGVVSLRSRGLL